MRTTRTRAQSATSGHGSSPHPIGHDRDQEGGFDDPLNASAATARLERRTRGPRRSHGDPRVVGNRACGDVRPAGDHYRRSDRGTRNQHRPGRDDLRQRSRGAPVRPARLAEFRLPLDRRRLDLGQDPPGPSRPVPGRRRFQYRGGSRHRGDLHDRPLAGKCDRLLLDGPGRDLDRQPRRGCGGAGPAVDIDHGRGKRLPPHPSDPRGPRGVEVGGRRRHLPHPDPGGDARRPDGLHLPVRPHDFRGGDRPAGDRPAGARR